MGLGTEWTQGSGKGQLPRLTGPPPPQGLYTLTASDGSCHVPCPRLPSGWDCGHGKAFWSPMWRASPNAHGFINCLNPLMRFLSGLPKETEPSRSLEDRASELCTQRGTSPTLHPTLFTPSGSQVTTALRLEYLGKGGRKEGEPSCAAEAGGQVCTRTESEAAWALRRLPRLPLLALLCPPFCFGSKGKG